MDGYLYMLLLIIPTSSAGMSLTGSSSSARLGQSFRFTCTETESTTGLVMFTRNDATLCSINHSPCQQFRAPSGYNCSCGQSGVYHMDITSVSKRDEETWKCKGSRNSNNITLPVYCYNCSCGQSGVYHMNITSVSKRDEETRKCKGSRNSNNITLPVYYGPNNVTVGNASSVAVTEDVTVSLTVMCSAVCNPACNYTWSKRTQSVSDNRYLPISSFRRGQAGNYTCTARNSVSRAERHITVNVQWHPAKPTHNCPHWIVLGQTSSCTCQTSDRCNPAGTIQWISKGGQMISSSVSSSVQLNLTSIRRSDNRRNYICRANNALPNSNSDTTYMANIAYLERPQLKFDKVEAQGTASVTVTCTVESNPIAEMTVETIGSETQPAFGNTNNLTFTLDKTQCLQNMFRCTVENSQTKSLISTMKQISVACSPRPDSSKQTDTMVTGKLKTTASLTADVIANPLPNFTWYHYQGMTPVPVVIGTDNVVLTKGLQSVLKVHIKRDEDYGIYRVFVQNREGIISLFFSLTKDVSTPEAPSCNTLPVAVGEGTVIVIMIVVIVFILHRQSLFKVLPGRYAVDDDGKIMTGLQRHRMFILVFTKRRLTNRRIQN